MYFMESLLVKCSQRDGSITLGVVFFIFCILYFKCTLLSDL